MLAVNKLNSNAIIPKRATSGSAGYDLYACEDTIAHAGKLTKVHTGIAVQIPPNTYGRIADRSSLASKSLHVFAGVIDSDYRGEIVVLIFNHGDNDYHITAGSRIAQLILEVIATPSVVEVDKLVETERGIGGFGSTGV